MQNIITRFNEEQNVLLIVDEAHNFGSKRLSELLPENIKYRIALSEQSSVIWISRERISCLIILAMNVLYTIWKEPKRWGFMQIQILSYTCCT